MHFHIGEAVYETGPRLVFKVQLTDTSGYFFLLRASLKLGMKNIYT